MRQLTTTQREQFIAFLCLLLLALSPYAEASAPSLKLTGRRGLVYRGHPKSGIPEGSPLYQIEFKEWDDAQTGAPVRVESSTHDLKTQNATSKQEVFYRQGRAYLWKLSRPDLKLEAEVERKEDRIFLRTTRGDRTEKTEEVVDPNSEIPLLLGPTLGRFLRENITKIRSGAHLLARLYVISRRTSYQFEIFATTSPAHWMSETSPQADWIHIEFKPSSFIIAALAPELHFWLDPKTGELRAYQGQLESREWGSEKMFDGAVLYSPFYQQVSRALTA